MTDVLNQLGRNQQRGSKPRCHTLTHGDPARRAAALTALVAPWAEVRDDDVCMPDGFQDTAEAQLHAATRLIDERVRTALTSWWLAVPSNATTPNWDIACTCRIGGARGLLLVEARRITTNWSTKPQASRWTVLPPPIAAGITCESARALRRQALRSRQKREGRGPSVGITTTRCQIGSGGLGSSRTSASPSSLSTWGSSGVTTWPKTVP